jgi:hypothetical protein
MSVGGQIDFLPVVQYVLKFNFNNTIMAPKVNFRWLCLTNEQVNFDNENTKTPLPLCQLQISTFLRTTISLIRQVPLLPSENPYG